MSRLLLLVFFLCLSPQVFAAERILSFHSAIAVAANGELTVTETIAFNVEGREIKRGILREFPTDYVDRLGRRVTVPFELLSVRRGGAPEQASLSRRANGVSIRIGNPNVLLPPGRQVYEISYRTRYQLGFFDQHDELYWNVTGNGWTFAIDEASAELRLPSSVPAADFKLEGYTGFQGATQRNYRAEALDGGARFRTTQPLARSQGLTIVAMFPKGVVAPPTLREKLDRWLKDNTAEVVGLAGFLVVLGFLSWRWSVEGRDPRAGPAFPRYAAPAGLGPAGVRYLDRMACDDRCFASALLGLAQRGYLRIVESEGRGYELRLTGKAVEPLPGEAPIVAMLNSGVDHFGRSHDPRIEQARSAVAHDLQRRFGKKLFSRNISSFAGGVILGAMAFGLMALFEPAPAALIAMGVALLATLAVFWYLLPAYTTEGRRTQDEVEGLRQYLSVAEKDDLARQKRPPRTAEEFARFLPYAVALGVEKTWADTFARVLGAAALSQAASAYYSSGSGGSFSDARSFTGSIASFGGAISAASTPPGSSSGDSSSGSSGGGSSGSSGGGGGGGGGSGW